MPRLLACRNHRTVEVLPDYNSESDREGKYDHHLKEAVERHLDKYGSDPDKHQALLLRLDEDEFGLLGDDERLRQAIFDNKLEEYLRGERDQLKADALRCYELHGRPAYGLTLGCQDYRNESRVVVRTKGRPAEEQLYLCSFCPYQSYVDHAKRKMFS